MFDDSIGYILIIYSLPVWSALVAIILGWHLLLSLAKPKAGYGKIASWILIVIVGFVSFALIIGIGFALADLVGADTFGRPLGTIGFFLYGWGMVWIFRKLKDPAKQNIKNHSILFIFSIVASILSTMWVYIESERLNIDFIADYILAPESDRGVLSKNDESTRQRREFIVEEFNKELPSELLMGVFVFERLSLSGDKVIVDATMLADEKTLANAFSGELGEVGDKFKGGTTNVTNEDLAKTFKHGVTVGSDEQFANAYKRGFTNSGDCRNFFAVLAYPESIDSHIKLGSRMIETSITADECKQ